MENSSKNQFILYLRSKKSQFCFMSAIFSLHIYLNTLMLYFQFDVERILI